MLLDGQAAQRHRHRLPVNSQPCHPPHLRCQAPDAAHNAVQVLAPSIQQGWSRRRALKHRRRIGPPERAQGGGHSDSAPTAAASGAAAGASTPAAAASALAARGV